MVVLTGNGFAFMFHCLHKTQTGKRLTFSSRVDGPSHPRENRSLADYQQDVCRKMMNIHTLYEQIIFKIWRAKRILAFERIIQPSRNDLILDVGGYPDTWTSRPQLAKRIDCLNVHTVDWECQDQNYAITMTIGDGCALNYLDGSYDILFSNSVIEHVGDWERQKAFACEARRVGKRLWIQTPAYECPIEPHFLTPFVHWLPVRVRRRLLRWFSLWGWLQRPSQNEVDETIAFTQLLTKKQVEELFPDCVVMTERLMGIFRKSYIAYRIDHAVSENATGDPSVSTPVQIRLPVHQSNALGTGGNLPSNTGGVSRPASW